MIGKVQQGCNGGLRKHTFVVHDHSSVKVLNFQGQKPPSSTKYRIGSRRARYYGARVACILSGSAPLRASKNNTIVTFRSTMPYMVVMVEIPPFGNTGRQSLSHKVLLHLLSRTNVLGEWWNMWCLINSFAFLSQHAQQHWISIRNEENSFSNIPLSYGA